MFDNFRRLPAYPVVALFSTLLWGIVEFVALQGARRIRTRRL